VGCRVRVVAALLFSDDAMIVLSVDIVLVSPNNIRKVLGRTSDRPSAECVLHDLKTFTSEECVQVFQYADAAVTFTGHCYEFFSQQHISGVKTIAVSLVYADTATPYTKLDSVHVVTKRGFLRRTCAFIPSPSVDMCKKDVQSLILSHPVFTYLKDVCRDLQLVERKNHVWTKLEVLSPLSPCVEIGVVVDPKRIWVEKIDGFACLCLRKMSSDTLHAIFKECCDWRVWSAVAGNQFMRKSPHTGQYASKGKDIRLVFV
jgi:hypothetical protein